MSKKYDICSALQKYVLLHEEYFINTDPDPGSEKYEIWNENMRQVDFT